MGRLATIDKDLCKPDKCGGQPCIRFCPIVKGGKRAIWFDHDVGRPVISEVLCVGCGICVHKCPFDAITIVNMPEELEGECVHRYGPSGFKLYRLPLMKRGTVVGVMGQNALGKTTIARILAGELRPNLCRVDGDVEANEVIRMFRGTEMQTYLKSLYGGGLRAVHKVQYVELIPLYVKGRVADVLSRLGGEDALRDVVERLGLQHVMERDVSNLSGGELQKVAVAAAMLRGGDIYIFDEPTTHLDIYERMRVSNAIRDLAGPDRYVVVIEHDLAVLDYVADSVVLLYGKPGAYGIVSHPRGAREGINEYLQGYLASENMKIRDYSIQFHRRPPERRAERSRALVSWERLFKAMGDFKLVVETGTIYRGEVLGVVGPNGIGKTTFVKMLAGEVEPDEGHVMPMGDVKVSYKPQYIRDLAVMNRGIPVRTWMSREAGDYSGNPIWPDVSSGLLLGPLMERDMDELSGGELQRVVLAASLLRRATLYILDEPMAYLDVEQRIRVARTVRRIIEESESAAIVVEHDIAMVDYVSTSIMPFLGTPAKEGHALGPMDVRNGMNAFLKYMDVTFRKDPKTFRPRINKPGSVLDREQKQAGEYYYYE